MSQEALNAQNYSHNTKMYSKIDIPMYIGDKEIFTNDKRNLSPPHEHKHIMGTSNYGGFKEVQNAINAAMKAKKSGQI